jgi:tetratricopeptide (TPR) repeat protein
MQEATTMQSNNLLRCAATLTVGAALIGSMAPAVIAGPPTTAVAAVATMGPPTVDEARALQGAGRWDEAAKAWKGIVDDDPTNGTAWFNLGYCLHAGGHLEQAVKAHKKAATFDDYHGIALYNLGCAYALMGRSDDAFDALNASQAAGFRMRGQAEGDSDLESLRRDHRFQAMLAREEVSLENRLEQLGQRLEKLGQRIERWVGQEMPKIQRRFEMFAQQMSVQIEQMMMQLQRKLAQDPRFADAAHQIQQAMEGHKGAAQHAPHDKAHEQDAHAKSHEKAHESHDAKPERESASSRSDKSADAGALLNNARKLQQQGKWLDAAKAYHAAAQAAPDNPGAWFGTAYCLHMAGEYEKAIKAHKKAATFEQTRGISLYNLACAYSLTKQLDEAFEALMDSHEAGFDLADSIKSDSDLDNLRDDPRFAQLLVELGGDI